MVTPVPGELLPPASGQASGSRSLGFQSMGGVDTVTTTGGRFVRTDLTADNRFPMPFLIEPNQAASAICDGPARERTQIVFPLPMAVLMKTARLVPAGVWTALWTRRAPR